MISDFGLSRVMEEFETVRIASSFFAGSTRWMAPELILALVQDDGSCPTITTYTDVYAFGSVCLEVSLAVVCLQFAGSLSSLCRNLGCNG